MLPHMGAANSKEGDAPNDMQILQAISDDNGQGKNMYAELLIDPIVKTQFAELHDLLRHNSANDLNYMCRLIAKFQKEKMEVLTIISKLYSDMLKDVVKMDPELKTEEQRFKFLADDQNLLMYFYWVSGSKAPSVTTMLTGQESPEIMKMMAKFVGDLRMRDARSKYYSFKYCQATLFQAAFAFTMWKLAKAFTDTTRLFHRARETVFGSVFKQMQSIVSKYTLDNEVKLDDVDQLQKVARKLMDVKQLAEVREKLDEQKMMSVKDLLVDIMKVDDEIANDPGRILPLPQGYLSGVEITDKGLRSIDRFKPTGFVSELPKRKQRRSESDEEYQKYLEESKELENSITTLASSPDAQAKLGTLIKYFKDLTDRKSDDKKHELKKQIREIDEELDDVRDKIREKRKDGDFDSAKDLEKRRDELEEELQDLKQKVRKQSNSGDKSRKGKKKRGKKGRKGKRDQRD